MLWCALVVSLGDEFAHPFFLLMKYLGPPNPLITLVGCLHGDETLGRDLFEHYSDRLAAYPGLALVLANEPAMVLNKRFIETDLNRSFPGHPEGSQEERLAAQLLARVRSSRYVLDIHNTTTDIDAVPIATNLSDESRRIINLFPTHEVALIEPPLAGRSLIGQLTGGVSLEFNFDFARGEEALKLVDHVIVGLIQNQKDPARERSIFHVTGSIPKSTKLPEHGIRNFELIEELGVYPFLYGERSYPDIHALAATSKTIEVI